MPSYRLTYFPFRGRAEAIKQLFALAGVDYEDVVITRADWPKHKPLMQFGTIPVLEVDGVQIGQSKAAARYLARQFGYAGKTPIEEALVDAIVDQFADYFEQVRPFFRTAAGVLAGDAKEVYAAVVAPVRLQFFSYLHKFLERAGSGYLVGSSLTFADLFIAEHLFTFDELTDGQYLADQPALRQLVQKVHSEPAIAKWIATRPANKF